MKSQKWSVLWMIVLLVSAVGVQAQQDDLVTIRLINTADEHGWLEPFTPFGSDEVQGGAANIAATWQAAEGFDPDHTLILSSGDNWTGPSIATWFQGEPVVQAFNQMGYAATAIGNHEFDFGRDILAQRIEESNYAYLGANIRDAVTGDLADFAEPYIVTDVDGVNVGVIGLATVDTVTTTHPSNISDLQFDTYLPTLEAYVPVMRDEGADIIVGLTHICVDDLARLAYDAADLVDVFFGGHCNAMATSTVNGVPVIGSGWAWRSYAQLDITFNTTTGEIDSFSPELVRVNYRGENPLAPDADLEALIDTWRGRADDSLAEEIGYAETSLRRGGTSMVNLVADSWLHVFPDADVAVTNLGGFRSDLPAGSLTIGDVVGVLPFENRLIEVAITGAQLAENLACCGGAVSGITYRVRGSEVSITFLDGRTFDPDAIYHVIISDFMYYGGDDYRFAAQDPDGYDTGVQWRQPVIDWLLDHATTPDNPVENYVDPAPRF